MANGLLAFHSSVPDCRIHELCKKLHHLSRKCAEDVYALLDDCVLGICRYASAIGRSVEGEVIARELESARSRYDGNNMLAVREIMDTVLKMYTREAIGGRKVGWLYLDVNRRLRSIERVSRAHVREAMECVRIVTGELHPFGMLMWEGLLMLPPVRSQGACLVFRGTRVTQADLRGWIASLGKVVFCCLGSQASARMSR